MIIPTGDSAPRRTTPVFNYLLILANIAVFQRPDYESVVIGYALKPDQWMDIKTLFTSMFLHGGLLHLAFNMLFLWIVGDNVEDRLGHVPYLVFYLFAGLAGSVAHIIMALQFLNMASIPTVGASGAISGVMGAYLVFFPGARIKMRLWLIIFLPSFKLPSWGAIGLWVGSQVVLGYAQLQGQAKGQEAMVAVFAHLGGFLFGFLVGFLVRLFGKPQPRSDSHQ